MFFQINQSTLRGSYL